MVNRTHTYASDSANRLSPYFYLLIFREQVNNSLLFSFRRIFFLLLLFVYLPSFKGISLLNSFFALFQVVSHFHSLDGNISIETMHKSNEAKPRSIEFIACKNGNFISFLCLLKSLTIVYTIQTFSTGFCL